jgi:hypothetical protein
MKKVALLVLLLMFLSSSLYAEPSIVKIVGTKGNWGMTVNGKPFIIKGFGAGKAFGSNGENYMSMAKNLGANAVRTWGADQGTKEYLDEAASQGLMVGAGIWINQTHGFDGSRWASYLPGNEAKLAETEKAALDYVKQFKDHPAILYWSVGNECIFFTKDPAEKLALVLFIEKLAKKIKEIDPNHPVTYTAVGGWGLEESISLILEHVKSLDFLVVNQFDPYYEGIDFIRALWEWKDVPYPLAMGEFAPIGYWLAARDEFDLAIEETDTQKAHSFSLYLPKIFSVESDTLQGYCLGGFAYHLGENTQDSLSWWDVNYKTFIRQQGLVIKQFYTGEKVTNFAPVITDLYITDKIIPAGSVVVCNVHAYDPEQEPLAYDIFVATAMEGIASQGKNTVIPVKKIDIGNTTKFVAPKNPGTYKVHMVVYDLSGHCAVYSKPFQVVAANGNGNGHGKAEVMPEVVAPETEENPLPAVKKEPSAFKDPVDKKDELNCM